MPAGTGYGSPVVYPNGDVGVLGAPRLIPAPADEKVDSKRSRFRTPRLAFGLDHESLLLLRGMSGMAHQAL